MTRGRGGGVEDIEGGSENFQTPENLGDSENLYTSKPTGGGGRPPKKLNR